MRKTTSFILALLLTFSFSIAMVSCSKNDKKDEDIETTSSYTDNGEDATDNIEVDPNSAVVLKTDKTEVAPGEEIKVVINVKGVKYFESADFTIVTPEGVEPKKCRMVSSKEGIESVNNFVEDSLLTALYVPTTIEFDDEDIFEATYTVNEDVKSGTVIKFVPELRSFKIGTDEAGDTDINIKNGITTSAVSVTVK